MQIRAFTTFYLLSRLSLENGEQLFKETRWRCKKTKPSHLDSLDLIVF